MALHTADARSTLPDKIVLYGVEGVGKTSWAAQAPAPVFLCAEDGIRNMEATKLLSPTGGDLRLWSDVMGALEELLTEAHDFKTLVIDTADWLEPIIKNDVIASHFEASEAKFDAFGRGYSVALTYWRKLLDTLDMLREKRRMEIIVLAHAQLKAEESPSLGIEVKRFNMKIRGSDKCDPSAMIREWCDSLLFATFEEMKRKDDAGKVKGNPTGRRVLKTQHAMMWRAKTRWKIPAEIPLSYEAYAKHRGTVSRLPEYQSKANVALALLEAHPAVAEMRAEAAKCQNDETKLGALLQELEAAVSMSTSSPF